MSEQLSDAAIKAAIKAEGVEKVSVEEVKFLFGEGANPTPELLRATVRGLSPVRAPTPPPGPDAPSEGKPFSDWSTPEKLAFIDEHGLERFKAVLRRHFSQ